MSEAEAMEKRLEEIRRQMAAACQRSHRDLSEVTLVAVSKGQPLERLKLAWEVGIRTFGENRVQEAEAKAPHFSSQAQWHLIGPLQTNKAKRAVGLFSWVHSVDRLKLARTLDREARAANRRIRCFLEINLGQEASKHGFNPDTFFQDAESLLDCEHLQVEGLMAIPPRPSPEDFSSGPEQIGPRHWFRRLRELGEELRHLPGWESYPGLLSMGMSGDFETAIEEGATHVRVGTALFGPRPGAVT